MRSKVLPWMACALVALVFVPALALGDPHASDQTEADGTFLTYDNGFYEAGQPSTDSVVNIQPGERVTFRSPIGGEPQNQGVHNVDFFEDSPQPTACIQTVAGPGSEPDTNDDPPLPDSVQSPGWEGYCTFTSPGVYEFFCQAHGGMEGTVVVGNPTPTPTPTATPSATPTPTPTATPSGTRLEARDGTGTPPYWWQDTSNPTPRDSSITIKAGERVNFGYPTGTSVHNLAFTRRRRRA